MSKSMMFLLLTAASGLLSAGQTQADGFLPQLGWSCVGSNAQYPWIGADVLFMMHQEGKPLYWIRVSTSAKADGQDPTKLARVDRVPEHETAQSFFYSGSTQGESAELTIQKVEGSDQDLIASLTATGLEGAARMICGRTRN